jgi:hypothetical protein
MSSITPIRMVTNASGSDTGSGASSVASGATLGGTGIISGAITNNGTISPGASVGILTASSDLIDGANSHWVIELSGASADLLAVGGNITLNASPTGLSGDFNSDGTVDAQDYVVWRKRADGNPSTALPNDNGLGTPVGSSHYALWRANFGKPPGAGRSGGLGAASVPEPANIGLVLIGLAAFGLGRRKRGA